MDITCTRDIYLQNNASKPTNASIWLDFGGIAKGYAIDQAIQTLGDYGVDNAIINAGGDLRSIGTKGEQKWKVAIRRPNSDDVQSLIVLSREKRCGQIAR